LVVVAQLCHVCVCACACQGADLAGAVAGAVSAPALEAAVAAAEKRLGERFSRYDGALLQVRASSCACGPRPALLTSTAPHRVPTGLAPAAVPLRGGNRRLSSKPPSADGIICGL
jgi:hypothetical protein